MPFLKQPSQFIRAWDWHQETQKCATDGCVSLQKNATLFFVTKNKVPFLKKPLAVQIKLRKVATKLQNVSPSAGSILPMVISLKKNLSIAMTFLPNKNFILSRIKNLPVPARTVERRVEDMAADVKIQQAMALQSVNTFSVALDESVDINDIPRLAIIARYCSDDNVQGELCCLSSMYGSTKEADIFEKFIDHFEKRQIDIKKIFAITTDGAAAMVERDCSFVALIEEKIGHPVMKFYCIIHQETFVLRFPIQILLV